MIINKRGIRFDYLAINFSCGHLASISASSDFPNAQEPSLQLEAGDVTVPGPVAWSPAGLGASSPRPPDGCSMHSPARRPRWPPARWPPARSPPVASRPVASRLVPPPWPAHRGLLPSGLHARSCPLCPLSPTLLRLRGHNDRSILESGVFPVFFKLIRM